VQGIEPAMGSVPALGQHTDEVLRQLGFSDAEITRLHDIGVVR
jgi:formyl-CoA transferase